MQQEQNNHMPWTMLVPAFLMGIAMFAPMLAVPPMEHILTAELNLTHAQTGLLFAAPVIMIAAVAIPAGLVSDKIGFKKAAGIGIIIIAVGTILRGTATSASSLLAFSFIYGVGCGLVFPNLPKLVSASVPREKAGVATGIFTAGILVGDALGLAITMPLIYPITNTFQGVFYIWSIPPIIAAIVWWVLVKEPSHISTTINATGEPLARNKPSFRHILKNKNLWLVSTLLLLENFFFYNWAGWAPALVMSKGASVELAGAITSITVWVGIPTAFLAPRLAYKLGLRKPFIWVASLILAFVTWIAISASLPMIWLVMALVGITTNTRYAILLALPVEMMPEEEVGAASGLVLSIGYIGGILGAVTGGRIFDITGSLDLSLLVLVGIALTAFGIALKLPETGARGTVKN